MIPRLALTAVVLLVSLALLATEQVEAGLRANFSGRSDRIDDRVIAFNGTFAAHKR